MALKPQLRCNQTYICIRLVAVYVFAVLFVVNQPLICIISMQGFDILCICREAELFFECLSAW